MFRRISRFFRRTVSNLFGVPYLDVHLEYVGSNIVVDIDYNQHFLYHLDSIGYAKYETPDDKVMAYVESVASASVEKEDLMDAMDSNEET